MTANDDLWDSPQPWQEGICHLCGAAFTPKPDRLAHCCEVCEPRLYDMSPEDLDDLRDLTKLMRDDVKWFEETEHLIGGGDKPATPSEG